MSYTILDLGSYLQHYSPESILSDLSSFKPEKGNVELYRFLQESYDENGNRNDNFLDYERKNICRIYFVLGDKVENMDNKCVLNLESGTYPVHGYFSIAVKTLYKSNIHSDQSVLPKNNTNMYLIGHLCKNASYEWNKGGEYMLWQCFNIIKSVSQKIGMDRILIECEPILVDYYSTKKFKKVGINSKTGLYQMVTNVSETPHFFGK